MTRLFACALVALVSGMPAAATTYDLTGLGDLPGGGYNSGAYDINNSGQVVGSSNGTNGPEAFLWDARTGMQGLGDLPGDAFSSTAHGINDAGQVVGYSFGINSVEPFLWDARTGMQGLGGLPGIRPGGRGLAINNAGQLVGGDLRHQWWRGGVRVDRVRGHAGPW